jgi:hypothetical protein
VPETEALIQRVAGMIASARALPLSSSVKLDNKDEILELLREASERLPEELRQARWMIKDREEYLAATRRQADELMEAGRSEAQRLVQRTEILKEAQAQARKTLEQAREEATRLRLDAEDFADQRLAQFEIILDRTMKMVVAGRQKLSGMPGQADDRQVAPASSPAPGPMAAVPGPGLTAPTVGDTRWPAARPRAQVPGVTMVGGPPGPPINLVPTPGTVPGRNGPGTVRSGMTPGGPAPADAADEWGEDAIFDQDSFD